MRENVFDELYGLGPSMRPTLSSLDKLIVEPYRGEKIRPGDVVVFNHPASGRKIAHRVVTVKPEKILTKGDNNSQVDAISVSQGDILGRVVYFQRGKKRFYVYGGQIGQLYAFLFKIKSLTWKTISVLFGPAYRALAKTGIVLRLMPFREKMRTVVFNRPQGEEIQIFLGKLLIARRRPRNDNWYVRKPFLLLVESYIK